MFHLTSCPICQKTDFTKVMDVIDHSVSHETFHVQRCKKCNFLVTTPRPDDHDLPKYYISENYSSHNKTAKSFLDKIYQITRLYTLRWKWSMIKSSASNSEAIDILDFGCGAGSFLNYCKKQGSKIAGVEPSDIARAIAEDTTNEPIAKSIDDIKGSFNTITLWHVLEHIPDLNQTLEKLATRLNEKGTMFIAVPNIISQDAAHYKNNWAALDVPRHLWHFTPSSMEQLLTKNGLKIKQIKPMKLDAFYVSLLSEKYIRKGFSITGILKAFLNAISFNLSARTKEYSSLIYVVQK